VNQQTYSVVVRFNASHFNGQQQYDELAMLRDAKELSLPTVLGLLEEIHGHSWAVQISVITIPEVLPYFVADEALVELCAPYRDKNLSLLPEVTDGGHRATAERLAQLISQKLEVLVERASAAQRFHDGTPVLRIISEVTVEEGPDRSATVRKEHL
jgi:6-pyruvoyl-tetrahydropterin synthase